MKPMITGVGPTSVLLSPVQEAIRAKCFHPSAAFTEFAKKEVEQSITSRFEKMARRHPDRIAIKTATDLLTYAQLNGLANHLARAIRAQHGTEPQPVGLLFAKGPLQIAAMLGVLKAGMFFVLLDPSFPYARLSTIFEESQAKLLIAGLSYLDPARTLINRDARLMVFEPIDQNPPDENLCLDVRPDALAFITYTTGSTGKPKGVMQNHQNMLYDTMLRTNTYHVCENDRASLLASGTSQAVKNAFWVLLNGATLLPFDVQREGTIRLAYWLAEEKISIARMSSPLFRKLCEPLTGIQTFPDLRVLLLASDTIHKSDVELYKQYFPKECVLVTGLSSTETGLIRDNLIDHQTEIIGNEVPVGYPVEGKEVFLINDAGKEIGFNEVGEIAVRSLYISPGYWRQSDLTRLKWIPDPNGTESHIYVSGDLGLMLPDGCLIHRGRRDFRIKIRGYGVETAEVEKALLEHPGVREAIVTAPQNPSGETCLVAYFTANGSPPTTSELGRFLRKTLADYMIPSAFVVIDTLPLMPNGKLDRRALPTPAWARPELDTPFIAPRTPVEESLAGIWSEILGLEEVGIHDDFLDLGGHSLIATQIISRVIDRFRVELPVKSLLEAPTVAQMAVIITQNQAKGASEKDLTSMLEELERLSTEEAQYLLGRKDAPRSDKG